MTRGETYRVATHAAARAWREYKLAKAADRAAKYAEFVRCEALKNDAFYALGVPEGER